jgi:hypothetical protein
MTAWHHDTLAEDLAAHLWAGGEHLTWLNFSPKGMGSARPDVYAIRRFGFDRPDIISYEVKVSAADLRSDLTSGKWQRYLAFSGGVTFAVPHGLCTKADIPDGCGLILRSKSGWRHTRKPTLQRVAFDMDTALRLINARPHRSKRGIDYDDVGRSWAVDRAERVAVANALRAIGERFGREVATVVAARARGEDLAADAKAKAETERARARDDVRAAWDELAEAVGLPKGKSSWDIRHAVHATRDRLSKDDEVKALRQQMRAIELALSKARLPVDEVLA